MNANVCGTLGPVCPSVSSLCTLRVYIKPCTRGIRDGLYVHISIHASTSMATEWRSLIRPKSRGTRRGNSRRRGYSKEDMKTWRL